MFSKTVPQKFKPANKQEFDRIIRLYPETFFGTLGYLDGCYFTNATYQGCSRSYLFYGLASHIHTSCKELTFNCFEEKEMFDFKNTPWYVKVTSQTEFDAVQEWLLSNYGSNFNMGYHHTGMSLSNFDFTGKILDKIVWWIGEPANFNCEIKLNYKTTVDSVEYPEITDQKQIEIEKIREEMETLTERLKKLENS